MIWTRSSFCADRQCVEVARIDVDTVALRDGKNIDQPHLTFNGKDWRSFLDAIADGDFAD